MNDDMKKNQIMAIVLSLAILVGWQYFFVYPKEAERRRQAAMAQSVVPPAIVTPPLAAELLPLNVSVPFERFVRPA